MARSATQAQLMLFFVNPPLMALSGRFTPIEAMPKWIQPFTYPNPIAHFATLARGVLVRGSGVDAVYVHLLALGFIATLLVGSSAWKFRGQMSWSFSAAELLGEGQVCIRFLVLASPVVRPGTRAGPHDRR
jgi:ABC-2 type transport system permease protein